MEELLACPVAFLDGSLAGERLLSDSKIATHTTVQLKVQLSAPSGKPATAFGLLQDMVEEISNLADLHFRYFCALA